MKERKKHETTEREQGRKKKKKRKKGKGMSAGVLTATDGLTQTKEDFVFTLDWFFLVTFLQAIHVCKQNLK